MKKMRNKAVVTLDDFAFYVIYQHEGGYGNHTLQRMRKHVRNNITGCKAYGKSRMKQTEWVPIKQSDTGAASIKYVGALTYSGIEKLIYNSCVSNVSETMGSITENGTVISAISLSTEMDRDYSCYKLDPADITKRFGKNCLADYIDSMQGIYFDDIYVSCTFSEVRFNEIVEQVLKGYTGNDKQSVIDGIERNMFNICEKLTQHLRHLTDEYHYESSLVPQKIRYDARQLEINFKEEAI